MAVPRKNPTSENPSEPEKSMGSQRRLLWKRLALLFAKMALEALLLGKGPLAGLMGTQGGGLFSGTPFGGSFGDAMSKIWGGQSASQASSLAPTLNPSSQASDAINAAASTPAASASATTQAASSAVTPKFKEAVEQVAQKAIEQAAPNVPTPPSRPSDLTPSAPLPPRRPGQVTPGAPMPPRRPLMASDGLPAPIPPENIPNVGTASIAERVAFYRAYAQSKGVDPNTVTGIVMGEGGNKKKGESWANPDPSRSGKPGTSYGDFQMRRSAQGGMGDDFHRAHPDIPMDAAHWREQGKYAIDRMSKNGTGAWMSVEDAGGKASITERGRKWWAEHGKKVDMEPTGSIGKAGDQAAKQASTQAQQAAEKAQQAQQKLSEQLTRSSQAVQQVTQPLQGMDAGVGQLTGSLSQGIPAAGGFEDQIAQLIQQMLSGLGGGGGGLGNLLGGLFGGFAEGGSVSGPGTATSDSIPAMLSNGEFVIRASAAQKHGRLLEMINAGKTPRFAIGGMVGGAALASSSTYAPVTTVNLTGSGNGRQDAILAKQVGDAVAAAQQRPDSFRRSKEQTLAAAFRAMSRSHSRNG